jgi:hypothetical protein
VAADEQEDADRGGDGRDNDRRRHRQVHVILRALTSAAGRVTSAIVDRAPLRKIIRSG